MKTTIILAALCLTSCAMNAAGEKTFLSLTGTDWAIIGKQAAITGAKTAAADAFIQYGERRSNVGPFTAIK